MSAIAKHNEEINERVEERRDIYDGYNESERSETFIQFYKYFYSQMSKR